MPTWHRIERARTLHASICMMHFMWITKIPTTTTTIYSKYYSARIMHAVRSTYVRVAIALRGVVFFFFSFLLFLLLAWACCFFFSGTAIQCSLGKRDDFSAVAIGGAIETGIINYNQCLNYNSHNSYYNEYHNSFVHLLFIHTDLYLAEECAYIYTCSCFLFEYWEKK